MEYGSSCRLLLLCCTLRIQEKEKLMRGRLHLQRRYRKSYVLIIRELEVGENETLTHRETPFSPSRNVLGHTCYREHGYPDNELHDSWIIRGTTARGGFITSRTGSREDKNNTVHRTGTSRLLYSDGRNEIVPPRNGLHVSP